MLIGLVLKQHLTWHINLHICLGAVALINRITALPAQHPFVSIHNLLLRVSFGLALTDVKYLLDQLFGAILSRCHDIYSSGGAAHRVFYVHFDSKIPGWQPANLHDAAGCQDTE